MPIVQKLMVKTMDQETVKKYAEMLESNLDELTSPFAKMIVDEQAKLSPREFEICTLVKNGLSSKEIAQLLHVSVLTVERHRHNIRKKLGLAKEKLNLQTFLRHL
jgi:DNA-binding NarL/FixJ family response regulator